ncbi:fimbrial biogenesis chaperone [Erythrobacter alti]|uniref:fimbrial biogenesis chaperone n=1 Tax=Erythrobacter alti TaxID=1896145 RepID=UPI0030F3FADF
MVAACLPADARSQAATPRANMNVTPLSLSLPSGQSATQMLVRNQGEDRLAIQLRVFEWTQVDGEDHYAEAEDIIVSPSIVRIEPGQAQSFHVLSRSEHQAGREGRYRVVIDELPGTTVARSGTAQTRLRLTLPLFTGSDTVAPASPQFVVQPGKLLIGNSGGRVLRLTNLEVNAAGQPVDLGAEAALQYVFSNSWVSIPLPIDTACSDAVVSVSALAADEPIDAIAHQDCS